jgi:excisionase family DNA binding protein
MAKMFYTLSEAADRLGKSPAHVRAMVESGELQEFRSGDELVVKREQIDLLVGDDPAGETTSSDILGPGGSIGGSSLGSMGIMETPDDDDEPLGMIGLSDSVADDDAPIISTGNDDSLVIGLEESGVGLTPDLGAEGSVGGSVGGSLGGSLGLTDALTDNISLDGETKAGSGSSSPKLADSGSPKLADASGIISLASQSGSHMALDLQTPNAKDQTGISIFDDGLDDDDASAATIVTDATVPDMSAQGFDGGASGSGLLDLTREGDDTSLGVDLLDAGGSGMGMAAVGAGVAGGALFEAAEPADADIARTMPAALLAEPYDSGGSGLVGGLALGVLLSTLFSGALTVLWLRGGSGSVLFEQLGGLPWFAPAAAIGGLTLLVTIIAWVLGRRG